MQQLHGTQAQWDALPKPALALAQFAVIWDTGRVFVGTASGDLEIGTSLADSGPTKLSKENYQIAFESQLSDQVRYRILTSTDFHARELWDGSVTVVDGMSSNTTPETLPVPSSGEFSGDAPKIIRVWSASGANDPTPSGEITSFSMTTVGTDANVDDLTIGESVSLNLAAESLSVQSFVAQQLRVIGSLQRLNLTDVNIEATNSSAAFSSGLGIGNLGLTEILIENSQFRSSYTHSTSSASNSYDVDLRGNNLDTAALNTFANQMPTFVDTAFSVGSVNVTGNPGAVSFDNSILTGKGYMVVGV